MNHDFGSQFLFRWGGVASLRPKPSLSCKGQLLCSPSEALSNKPLHPSEARGLKTLRDGGYEPPSEAECLLRAQEQKAWLEAHLAGMTEQRVKRRPRAQSVPAEQETETEQ